MKECKAYLFANSTQITLNLYNNNSKANINKIVLCP